MDVIMGLDPLLPIDRITMGVWVTRFLSSTFNDECVLAFIWFALQSDCIWIEFDGVVFTNNDADCYDDARNRGLLGLFFPLFMFIMV